MWRTVFRRTVLSNPSRFGSCRLSHSGIKEIPIDLEASSLLAKYQLLLNRGVLKQDPYQYSVIHSINSLSQDIKAQLIPPKMESENDLTTKIFIMFDWVKTHKPQHTLKGMYLYGSVGTGKTMLMDLFHSTLPPEVTSKRIHFHEFMRNVHNELHQLRTMKKIKDPLPFLVKSMSKEFQVLCIDEFQVTDIADAMILRRLLTEFFRQGVILFTTSNRQPEELYKNGIQRDSFIPCIELLKEKCQIINLDSGLDYRRTASNRTKERERVPVYIYPINETTNKKLQIFLRRYRRHQPVNRRVLEVLGREVKVNYEVGKLVMFTFDDLCSKPMGSSDYLALCSYYDIFVIRDIPQLGLSKRNEARRFITLLDTLYDTRKKVIFLAENDLGKLFSENRLDSLHQQAETRILADDLKLSMEELSKKSIFSGEEEIFAFQRAISRISEMQSEHWVGEELATFLDDK